MTIKPMLASKVSVIEQVRFPVLASPKLDGVRCLIVDGVAMTRNMKPIKNKAVADILSGLPNFDGELVAGEPTGNDVFNRTQSAVMSAEGFPKVTYHVFDVVPRNDLYMPFTARLELAARWAKADGERSIVKPLRHSLIKDVEALRKYEEGMVAKGYEGVMLRDPNGPYKHGRSTEREGYLLKLKRFEDAEAEVIGFVELQHNQNELTRDELGRAKRTTHKGGKVNGGKLGALHVVDTVTGVQFEIGTGFDDAARRAIWANPSLYQGRTLTYTYQPAGVKEKPRFPVFKGWREDLA